MSPPKVLFPFILAGLLFLGGCWDVEEVEKKSLITAIGIDAVLNNQLLLTLQLPNPGAIIHSGSQASQKKLFYTISTTASTTLGACTDLEAKTSDTLDTAQTKVIIFGRKLAETGLAPHLDCFGRFPKINPQAILAMAEPDAGSLLKMEVAQEMLPGLYIMDYFTKDSKKGASHPITLWQFLQKMDSPTIDPFLPIIRYDRDERTFNISGIAAFRHDRLAFTLSPEETKLFGLLNSGLENAAFIFPWDENRKIGFHFTRSKVKSSWEPPNTIRLKVKVEGYFLEDTGNIKPLTDKALSRYEKMVAKNLAQQSQTLLQKLQQAKTDLLGMGKVVRAKTPGKWSAAWWRKKYPQIRIKVQFEFEMSRSGRMT